MWRKHSKWQIPIGVLIKMLFCDMKSHISFILNLCHHYQHFMLLSFWNPLFHWVSFTKGATFWVEKIYLARSEWWVYTETTTSHWPYKWTRFRDTKQCKQSTLWTSGNPIGISDRKGIVTRSRERRLQRGKVELHIRYHHTGHEVYDDYSTAVHYRFVSESNTNYHRKRRQWMYRDHRNDHRVKCLVSCGIVCSHLLYLCAACHPCLLMTLYDGDTDVTKSKRHAICCQ